ncbi:hypothetical protein EAG_10700, partial [Camponotus floridanus]
MGTRRIFTTAFKIKVLDSYRHDKDCRQNQRATARKYGIHRRQIQKWLQCEEQLRSSVENGNAGTASTISPAGPQSDGTMTEVTGNTVTPATPALNLNLARQHGDELTTQQGPPPPHPPHGSAPSSPQYSLHLDEEEIYDEGEEAIASSCIDYRRPPTGESLAGSLGPVSPMYDRNGYSLPSSPRDSVSIGRYRSSCSDSEMDPLISVGSLNSSSNFTRRRSFPLRFKLDVLDAFHRDKEVKENQRATARKFGINRRQVQKWLEQETELRDE